MRRSPLVRTRACRRVAAADRRVARDVLAHHGDSTGTPEHATVPHEKDAAAREADEKDLFGCGPERHHLAEAEVEMELHRRPPAKARDD